jgi:hypothetical protein
LTAGDTGRQAEKQNQAGLRQKLTRPDLRCSLSFSP